MSKKNTAHNKKAAPGSGPALETQFWNCLKKGDVEGLEEILLRRTEDAETGAATLSINREIAQSLVNTPNAKKVQPLSYAVSQGMDERGLHLLLRAGANVDATDGAAERSTALHAACWGEDDIVVALLLRCGANPLVTDADGRTPLHVLAMLNAAVLFSHVVEVTTTPKLEQPKGVLFLENRSPVVVTAFELFSKKDKADFTVLHTAVSDISSGSDHVVTELLDHLEQMVKTDPTAVKELVNMTTESGDTALHLLLSCPNCNEGVIFRITERLLLLGANPAATDKYGHTPLSFVLTTQSDSTAAKMLSVLMRAVQKTCDATQLKHVFLHRDAQSGYALVHHAIALRNLDAVRAMVEFLRSIDAANGSQCTQQWLGGAITEDKKSVVFMLAEHACDEIAQTLIAAHAIEEVAHENCKKEYRERKEREKQEEESLRRAQVEEADADNSEDGDHGTTAKGTGDFSGFGSTTAGSRVQQARKARSKIVAQKRKQPQSHRSNDGGAEGSLCACNRVHVLIVFVIVFVMFSMAIRTFNLFQASV